MRIFKYILFGWKLPVEESPDSVEVVQLLTETAATAGSWRTTLLTTGFITGHDSGSIKVVASSSRARLIVVDGLEVLTMRN